MRFGPLFDSGPMRYLPDNVPSELYEVGRRPKPVVVIDDELSEQEQLKLIKEIAASMDPRLLEDLNIFPLPEEVALEFSQLRVARQTSMLIGHSKYQVSNEGELTALRTIKGEALARGSTGDVFAYACQYAPGAVLTIVRALSSGRVSISNGPVPDNIAEALAHYREQRAFSPGLDRISKTMQLAQIDCDHVYNKFLFSYDMVEQIKHPVVYHLGAGDNVSGSVFALYEHYERVVCVDPRLKPGVDQLNASYLDVVLDGDVVSDMAFGDRSGMTITDKRAIEDLYRICHDRLVIVKYGVRLGIQARGILLLKPRPHNLEVIVQLTPDGDPLDEICRDVESDVHMANKRRNEHVFLQRFPLKLKPLANAPYEYSKVLTVVAHPLPVVAPAYLDPVTKPMVIYNQLGGVDNAERMEKFRACVRKLRNAQSMEPYGYYPVELGPGDVANYDPGFPSVEYSARSFLAKVRQSGLRIATVQNKLFVA